MAKTISCPDCGVRNRLPTVSSGRLRCGKCQTDLPWLSDVTTADFDQTITTSSLPVLVDLWAPWCGPCRSVAPALEDLARTRAGSLRVVKVNVDEEPTVSGRLGVQGIPTMVLYHHGIEVARQVGALPAAKIGQWVDTAMASP
jgi:thioredoxin 2